MGAEVDLWDALYTAVGDTIHEVAGHLIVRTTAPYVAGATSIAVEGTDRFPAAGRIAFGRKVAVYAAKTATSFTGLTDYLTGAAGVDVDLSTFSVVQDMSRVSTQLNDLRASFVLSTADGAELDILGRNAGIPRPIGVDDTTYRALLEAMLYLEAQTVYGCEQVLDTLWATYTLYEDLESASHTVYVLIPWTEELDDAYKGKAFWLGGEAHARTSASTVTVDYTPVVVSGVWASTDPSRTGTNYANITIATCSTSAASPDRLSDSGAGFLASDLQKYVIMDGTQHWQIAEVVSTSVFRLIGRQEADGALATDRLTTAVGWFEPWMAGHKITITASDVGNDGTYVIAAVVGDRELRLTGAAFALEAGAVWQLVPNFGTDASVSAEIPRATFVGAVITCPTTPLPLNVTVDYGTIPSAQVLASEANIGNEQYPFYLWDATAVTLNLLDLITAAGVQVVIVRE